MTESTPSPQFENAGSSNRYVLGFGVFMMIGLLTLAWIGRPKPVSAIGERLPKLDLQPLLNATEVSNASLVGKVTVLHFWGTWCHNCNLEFPEFVELVKEFSDEPAVEVLSVSCSRGAEYDLAALAENSTKFMERFDVSVPTYSDNTAMTRSQLTLLMGGSMAYPATLLVDQEGVIVDAWTGYLAGDMTKLIGKIKKLL